VTELCDGLTTRPLTTDDAQAVFEVIAAFTLGRTLKKRAVDVPTYFDRPGTSDGPTEAITAAWNTCAAAHSNFRNLTNYIARSLLETGGFRPYLHPRS
jgi:transposase